MINILCYVGGAGKPIKHSKPLGIIQSALLKAGFEVTFNYTSQKGLDQLESLGINTYCQAEEHAGERVWLVVYDSNNPQKSMTNEDFKLDGIHYVNVPQVFSSRKERQIRRELLYYGSFRFA